MIAIVIPITSYLWEHFVMPIFGIKVELSNRTWRILDMFISALPLLLCSKVAEDISEPY